MKGNCEEKGSEVRYNMNHSLNQEHSGRDLFREDLARVNNDIDLFITRYVFAEVPRPWPEGVDYSLWRHHVGGELKVDPSNITITGSMKLGYSLNPEKNFRKFNPGVSDIDIAVVSHQYFEDVWRETKKRIDKVESRQEKNYIRRLVFDECLAMDRLLPHVDFGAKWSRARDEITMSLGSNFLDMEINYRIYRSYESLREYQKRSVKEARVKLIQEDSLKNGN